MPKFYYLKVIYNVHDLELQEQSYLAGPFHSEAERQTSIDDLDFEEDVTNVTLLKVENDSLVWEGSFLGSECDDDRGELVCVQE